MVCRVCFVHFWQNPFAMCFYFNDKQLITLLSSRIQTFFISFAAIAVSFLMRMWCDTTIVGATSVNRSEIHRLSSVRLSAKGYVSYLQNPQTYCILLLVLHFNRCKVPAVFKKKKKIRNVMLLLLWFWIVCSAFRSSFFFFFPSFLQAVHLQG